MTDLPRESTARWYQDAIIYQLHVKVYRDSNGDGVGDFRGLVSKLDYLQDLGVTAIWLQPFYPSPLRDDGYDTADYRSVHASYGDLRDFKVFLREAKARGLRVITELVLNHTSDQHAWFQRARRAKPGSSHRDFYVWSDSDRPYPDARIIFKDFETSNWSWDPVAGAYFWHRFYSHQPDLNWENPAVVRELYRIVDFWFDMGVDGLRLDAVPYLFEAEGTNCENLPATHDALKRLRAHVDARHQDKMLLAEANMWPDEVVDYFGDGDECHMAFHFPLMPRMFMAIRMEDRFPIIDILEQTPPLPEGAQWATFLRNHDELTLEMVTDEERDYMWRIYAEDPRARINLGIRRRLAPLLGNNRRLIELMNGLLFSLPGTPVIYYGDEIGMGDNIYLGDRDGVRTPMQWSADRNAGFSEANPHRLFLPVVIDPEYHSSSVNVEAQAGNPESLLWWMRRLIAMRTRHPALSHGRLEWVPSENRKVLTYLRCTDDERILCVVNLSRYAQYVELDMSQFEGYRPVALLGNVEFPPIGELPYMLTLGPHDFYWFQLEPSHVAEAAEGGEPLPTVRVAGAWSDVLGTERGRLERLLPAYLQARRWFRAKARKIRGARIVDVVPVGTGRDVRGYITFVHVEFAEGDPQTYVLPLVARRLGARPGEDDWIPPSTIARVTETRTRDEYAVYDGLVDAHFCEGLLQLLTRRRRAGGSAGRVVGTASGALRRLLAEGGAGDATPLVLEQTNSTVAYGDSCILKVLRLVEEGTSPELELGQHLTDRAHFPHSPAVLGALGYEPGGAPGSAPPGGDGTDRTFAVLHEYVPNEGDAWSFTLDALDRYLDDALARTEAPEVPGGSLLGLAAAEVPELAHEAIGHYLQAARILGQRTAQMHVALASAPATSELAPERFTPMYRRSLYQSLRSTARRTFVSLRRQARSQPVLAEIAEREGAVLEGLRGVLDIDLDAQRIRCHGDYHLGQVLWTGRDFAIIDYEGEPARPIGERRIKRSPLKDVAGMVRSFSYAANMAAQNAVDAADEGRHAERVLAWTEYWYRWVAATFLRSYLDEAGDAEFLPSRRVDLGVLLEALLLEKALYELGYEADNRPEWTWIPVRGLVDLTGGAAR